MSKLRTWLKLIQISEAESYAHFLLSWKIAENKIVTWQFEKLYPKMSGISQFFFQVSPDGYLSHRGFKYLHMWFIIPTYHPRLKERVKSKVNIHYSPLMFSSIYFRKCLFEAGRNRRSPWRSSTRTGRRSIQICFCYLFPRYVKNLGKFGIRSFVICCWIRWKR